MREQEKAKCRDCELPFEECWCRAWDKLHGIRPAASPEPQPAPVEPELACTDCKEYRAAHAAEMAALRERLKQVEEQQSCQDCREYRVKMRERGDKLAEAVQVMNACAEHACMNECRDVRTVPGHELHCAHARQSIRAVAALAAWRGAGEEGGKG